MRRKNEFKFIAAPGASITDAEAALFGPELMQLAEDLQINSLRNLDKRRLFEYVEHLPDDSPLKQHIFRETDEEAAKERRVDLCAKLIRSIRYYPANVKVPRPVPLFVATRAPIVADGSIRQQQAHVFRGDLGKYDSTLVNAATMYIKRIRDAFGQLEHLTGDFPELPRGMQEFVKEMRGVIDNYDAVIDGKAAE